MLSFLPPYSPARVLRWLPSLLPQLMPLLAEPQPDVRRISLVTLGILGAQAAEVLPPLLSQPQMMHDKRQVSGPQSKYLSQGTSTKGSQSVPVSGGNLYGRGPGSIDASSYFFDWSLQVTNI